MVPEGHHDFVYFDYTCILGGVNKNRVFLGAVLSVRSER